MFTTVTGLALMHCMFMLADEDEPCLNSKATGMSDVTRVQWNVPPITLHRMEAI